MDDMLGKMGAILSDPESVKQLQELAQMLQQESNSENTPEEEITSEKEPSANEDGGGFDMSMLLRMQGLMGAIQTNDEDTKLLLALRPHLKDRRQKKVDQAVKLLKLYAVFSAVKENGLLQDLL